MKDYTCTVTHCTAERASQDELSDGLMDIRFLRAVERSLCRDGRFWSVAVHDAERALAASAFVSLYGVDPALFIEGIWKARFAQVCRALPTLRQLPVLMCGTPVSTGENHLRLTSGADRLEVLRVLDATMVKLARRHGSCILAFKEFDDSDTALHAALATLGYLRIASWPMNHLPTHFHSFDELCAATRSKYRNQIQRSVKKFARSGLRLEHVRDGAIVESLYTDEVHALYLAVLSRAEVKLEKLPAVFFRELARQFPREIVFTVARQAERVVGFVMSLSLSDHHFNLFCGIDYQLNEFADLYFNLMYRDADFALRHGSKTVNVGQASYDFKSRMGCYTRPRSFFVKVCVPMAAPILRRFAPLLFPPPPAPPIRNLFHDGETRKS